MDFSEDIGPSRTNNSLPPPLPPRPNQGGVGPSQFNSYGNFGLGGQQGLYSQYTSWRPNSYGVSSYGYPSYGSGYPQYNSYGSAADPYSGPAIGGHFEAASRPAFEMIESVVYTVGSISQLLDSSYNAILASFRSVMAVLEQFSRMKNQFSTLFSAFAMIRVIRWMRDKVLRLAAMARGQPMLQSEAVENAWSSSLSTTTIATASAASKDPVPFKWPLFMYLAVLLGAPYLTWKLVSSTAIEVEEEKKSEAWMKGEESHFVGQALYDFNVQSPDELGFRSGETLLVAPKELQPKIRGWLLASVNGHKSGLVPANRIKILGRKTGTGKRTKEPDIIESSTSCNNLEEAFQ